MAIESLHLRLLPYSPNHLLALIDGPEQFRRSFGLRAAEGLRGFFVSEDVSPSYFAQLRDSNGVDPWFHGFAVIDRESDMVVGNAGFKGPPDAEGIVEIAYGIVPAFEGKGYATEAALASRDYAYQKLGAKTLISLIHPDNAPSKHVATRMGARFEAMIDLADLEPHCVYRHPDAGDLD